MPRPAVPGRPPASPTIVGAGPATSPRPRTSPATTTSAAPTVAPARPAAVPPEPERSDRDERDDRQQARLHRPGAVRAQPDRHGLEPGSGIALHVGPRVGDRQGRARQRTPREAAARTVAGRRPTAPNQPKTGSRGIPIRTEATTTAFPWPEGRRRTRSRGPRAARPTTSGPDWTVSTSPRPAAMADDGAGGPRPRRDRSGSACRASSPHRLARRRDR